MLVDSNAYFLIGEEYIAYAHSVESKEDTLVQKYENSEECSLDTLIYELSCDDNVKSILLVSRCIISKFMLIIILFP